MTWLKKHIFEIVSLFVVFVSIIFLWNWVQIEPGKTIYKEALSHLPFLEFGNKMYEMVCKLTGETITAPLPEHSSIILDILKLLIASPVIMFARRIIFTKIPVVSNFLSGMPNDRFEANIQKEARATGAKSIPSDLKQKLMTREKEDYPHSFGYRLKEGIVDVFITICTLLFSAYFFEKYKDAILSFLSTKRGTLIGIISIVAFFFLYCFIFNKLYHGSFSFSIIKTLVFNIFPSIVTTLISGVLYYCCHMFMVENRNIWLFLIFFLILFFWCGIKNLLEKKLRIIATGYRLYYNFQFSTFISAVGIYISYMIAAQFYSHDIDIMLQNKAVQMFFNFKALPFYDYIISGTKVIDKMNLTSLSFILELLKLCFFAFSVCLISRLLKKIKIKLSIIGFVKWSVKISIEIGLVFFIYSFLLYATKNDILQMALILILFAIGAIVVNIIAAKQNSTSSISFSMTNILLESCLIIIGEIFLIYVAESIGNENFLHLSISYDPNGNIDSLMTSEFIVRMMIITIAMILWYILEALDLGIKKKQS